MTAIIFADIDGVLNNRRSLMRQAELKTLWIMDEECVQRLNNLILGCGYAEVVISSSWRHSMSFSDVAGVMADHGFLYANRVIDATPRRLNDKRILKMADNPVSVPRAWEIYEWLEHNKHRVRSYVVLDDDNVWAPSKTRPPRVLRDLLRRHVRTEHEIGLTDADVVSALRVLDTPLRAA